MTGPTTGTSTTAPLIAPGHRPGTARPDGPPTGRGVLALEAAGGAWHLAAHTGGYTAVWRARDTDGTAPAGVDGPVVVAVSSWDLEPRLGFVLPDVVHTTLAAGPPDASPGEPGGAGPRAGDDPPPGDTDTGREDRRPRPGDLLRLPGGPVITYRQALDASHPARTWHLPAGAARGHGIAVEIVGAVPAGDGRRALIYRVRRGDVVVACGDDIEVPGDVDLRADATLRGLVSMLTHPGPETVLTGRMREFLTRHGDTLLAAVAEPAAPYPPGSRIAVALPHTGRVTGTVAALTGGRDGQVRCYHWRPDTATRPGHPWHHPHGATATVVSPASAVTATLDGPDIPCTGDDAEIPRGAGAAPAAASPTGGSDPAATVAPDLPGEPDPSFGIRCDQPPTGLDGDGPYRRLPADRLPLDELLAAWPPAGPVPVTADVVPAAAIDGALPAAGPDAAPGARGAERAAATGLADVLDLAARAAGAGTPTGAA